MKILPEHRIHLDRAMERLDSSFFFYDLDFLSRHLKEMKEQVEGHPITLWYATKANPMSAILKEFRYYNFGVDISGKGELEQVLNAGFTGDAIISTGPSKARNFMNTLVRNGVNTIVLESLNQALWLNEIAKKSGKKVKVLLRVQLNWEAGKSVLGGDEITPFGLDPQEWLKLDVKGLDHLDIMGMHCFQWGNILEGERLISIWEQITSRLKSLSQQMNLELKVLDLGGGLGIPYDWETKELFFREVSEGLKNLQKKYEIPEIWMEIGRYAVGTCGMYLTQVIDKKTVRGREQLITDGGINHISRPALTGESFPCQVYRQDTSTKTRKYFVHGPLCTALDVLGSFDLPEDVRPGDWLVFHQAGAYGFTEAMPYFLCHNLPAEVTYKDGKSEVVRTVKTASSWLV